jgi:RND family efflux transporter MFP subunit
MEPNRLRQPAPRWVITTAKFGAALAAVTGTAVLLLVLAGVFQKKVPTVAAEPSSSPRADGPQVEARIIKRTRFETAIGTIKPVHESAMASKILARVAEVHVKAGQSVEKDELLVKLDDADLRARLEQAEAVEATSRAHKQQADADFERAKKLVETKVMTRADYDQAFAAMKAATSEVERSVQAVRETRVILEYATLLSPLTGTVVDKRVEVGDTVTPGQILLTLYDPTHMQMVATVRESLALRLSVGQKLPAQLESLGYQCEATVSEIVPEAQAASRSFSVKVIGPCPPGVYSGMFGRLSLPLEDEEVLVVPASAVRHVGQLTLVDAVVDGRVQRRAIQTGRTFDDDEVEVLSGLHPHERVLVATGVSASEPAGKGSP